MKLWDDEIEAMRPTLREQSDYFIAAFPRPEVTGLPPLERARVMREAESSLYLLSQKAADRHISGPAGPLRLREFRPDAPDGVMLHIHGGGWMTGAPELTDLLNEMISDSLNVAIVSVDYRLAPEDPYPAGPDDCEAAALWLIDHAAGEFGTDRILIGGESAGAHLAAMTLLRLRDKHETAQRILGANLVFGAYDMGWLPALRGIGIAPGRDTLTEEEIAFMSGEFLPGLSEEERRHPDYSPLYAELSGLPPALFTVGTDDHLFDDTILMAHRWQIAGNRAELLVYPDTPHACIGVMPVLLHWMPRLVEFLRGCLD